MAGVMRIIIIGEFSGDHYGSVAWRGVAWRGVAW
eukprot:CAMPEP_0119534800 /NCGR_PEP_ID=MMETSP1344-20130328/47971_1 /TAXON_ID=236787 /ORGANISM="Florenciella parvula, Strain CCMP2471" /LENGTH=33 /DNA_ID= /DNA_START= /DNA_END= /DNA_ORIENTATION=